MTTDVVHAIAVIGAGPVGRALAEGLRRTGNRVVIGVRSPSDEKYRDLAGLIDVVTIDDAIADSEASIIAVPAPALGSVLSAADFPSGHVVIDASNAVFSAIPEGFEVLGNFVASHLDAGVGFVKAFNTIGAEHLADGAFEGGQAFLPVAGDPNAVELVTLLASNMGFDVAALGGREAIGMVEEHARLWIHLAFKCGWGRDFGFTAVRR